jgi:hypothetical protein
MTRTAFGADPEFTNAKRLFWLATSHGGVFESSMFPDQSMLTDTTQLFSDHSYRTGKLVASTSGDMRSVSPVLTARTTHLSDSVISKMNVLYGLDIPFYIAHSTGGYMGNYAANDGNGNDGKLIQGDQRPTLDQIMAWSPSFYPDLSGIRERSIEIGRTSIASNYSSPSSKSGAVESVKALTSSTQLFDKIFVQTAEPIQTRQPLVDRVRESYRMLRNTNSRLSASDKQRLDDHLERIAELERKLKTVSSCGDVVAPGEAETHTGLDQAALYAQSYVDVVVAAFTCGSSRIATWGLTETNRFSSFAGDWHEGVAHQWFSDEPQAFLRESYQRTFDWIMAELATKLDVEEVPGSTYLDNSLLVWSQESGMETHGSVSLPVVTMGGAAGFFKTGQLYDYRRVGNENSKRDTAATSQYMGLLYSQWLATVLQSMGVPPAEFELWGHKGFGKAFLTEEVAFGPPYRAHYESLESRYFQMASDILPGLKA